MAIRNQINREPTGLLDLFRAKVGGVNPQIIREEVVPIVDIQSFLMSRPMKGAADSRTGSPPAAFIITVPSDEVWAVHQIHYAAYTSAAAADTESGVFTAVLTVGSTSARIMTVTPANPTGQTLFWGNQQSMVPNGKLILPAGAKINFSVAVSDLSTISMTHHGNILYTPFKV